MQHGRHFLFYGYVGVAAILLSASCTSLVVKDPDAEVGVLISRWIEGKVADDDLKKEIERLGGPDETVKRITIYVQGRDRSVRQRYAGLDVADLTQRYPPEDEPERNAWRGRLVFLMLWGARDEDRTNRYHAVELLSDELGGDPRALDVLVATAGNTNEWYRTREWALLGLEYFPRSDVAVKALVKALQIESIEEGENGRVDGNVRWTAVGVLCKSDLTEKVIELVMPLLADKRPEVREAAVEVIERIKKRKETGVAGSTDAGDGSGGAPHGTPNSGNR